MRADLWPQIWMSFASIIILAGALAILTYLMGAQNVAKVGPAGADAAVCGNESAAHPRRRSHRARLPYSHQERINCLQCVEKSQGIGNGVLQNQDHTISIKASRVLPISITAAETQSHDFH